MAEPSPTRLEEEVVEVMAREIDPDAFENGFTKFPRTRQSLAKARAELALTAFLSLARERGWKVTGPEIAESVATQALDATNGYLSLPGSKFSQNLAKMRLRWTAAHNALALAPWMEEKDG